MPLTPRSLVCVQRSGRPLLERPEIAVKFSRTEQCDTASIEGSGTVSGKSPPEKVQCVVILRALG
ncbi:hypothetical protein Taro_033787 [Colocasia esculenta]|uniref:Uncharacterized protein n=1 Tax=Colocasia esculenta TaxID=4460 RepID=A0A843W5Q6_COLES|nr:hypothetical protein [Colocasia esculenta]